MFQALTVELKEESGSSSTADSTELTLTLLKHSLVLNGATVLENESIDFLSMWTEGMSLVFGGVQGKATGKIHIYMKYQCHFHPKVSVVSPLLNFAFLSTQNYLHPLLK